MNTNKKFPKVSIIVSTYNRPETLDLCLQSIKKQSVLPNEVVIGDDGSKNETKELIEKIQQDFPVPLIHVWQEDKGFRLAMSRNKAVAASESEYIIEIDGDLILNSRFVEDHLFFAQKGYFLKGGRVNLTEKYTKKVCQTRKLPKRITVFSKGIMRRINSIHCIPLSKYFAPRYKKNRILGLGCNMSFWKDDFIKINGYDEFFEGWGGEDYDFANRLQNSGVKRLYLKFSGIVYHLWHQDFYMHNADKNRKYYSEKKDEVRSWCEKGVNQYLT